MASVFQQSVASLSELKGKRILVTGGSGFLGRHIAEHLLKYEAIVRVFDIRVPDKYDSRIEFIEGDLTKLADIQAACKGQWCVVHVASPAPTSNNEKLFMAVNVDGTKTLLKACQNENVPKVVYTSSASVVFEGKDQKNLEESFGYPTSPMDAYTRSKLLGEQAVLAAGKEKDGPATCALRPHGIFGPRDPHLVPALARAGKGNKSKYIIGDGCNLVDFTYVENVSFAHLLAAVKLTKSAKMNGEAYFITNREPVLFWDFLTDLQKGLGYVLPRINMPTKLMLGLAWVAGQAAKIVPFTPTFTKQSITYASTHHYYSSEKAYRDFGYHPPVPLSQAIDKTLAHFSQLKNPTPVNYADGLEKKTPGLGAMLKFGLLLALIAYLFSDSGSSALGAVGLSPWLAVLILALVAGFRARQEYCLPKFERFVPTEGLDLSGQIVLVTGGNKGIGRVTSEGYAKLKATVVIACRNEGLAKDAVAEIKKSTGNPNIHYVLLDLASVESVRQCAADYKKRFGPLSFLYNNAGAAVPLGTTVDGFNQEMQVNHLGHFLLTNLLLQQGSLADTARVINVSSILHTHANITAKTLDLSAPLGGMPGYCTVKLYNVLFSNHLNKLFKNSPVHYNKTSLAIHPGTYDTEFLDHILHPTMRKLLSPFLPYFTVHHREVSHPMLNAGLSPNLRGVGGIYLDQGNPAPASFPARDRELAAALWSASEKLLKADFSKIYS